LTGTAVALASLAFVVPAHLVVGLLSGPGGFRAEDAALFWRLLAALLGMLIGGCLGQITSTAFYAMGDTRTPTKLGVYVFSAYLPAKFASFFFFGLIGMATSISVYYICAVIVQLVVLEQVVRRRADHQPADAPVVPSEAKSL
jgi:putative peptidoglycan lipid II flippase